MGLSKLIPARPQDCTADTRAEIKKSVLKSRFLKGPRRSFTRPGVQPLGSGTHYTTGQPIITQFPLETLSQICSYLDPIWLLQFEASYGEIRDFLQSPAANQIWYIALPAALLTMPEFFQSERAVEIAQLKDFEYSAPILDATQWRLIPPVLSPERYHYEKRSPYHQCFEFPGLAGFTNMYRFSDLRDDALLIQSPGSDLQYPFIRSRFDHLRKRTLALGGPYDKHVSYRRELLGHAQQRRRCHMCYEIFNPHTNTRAIIHCDLVICKSCYDSMVLTSEQVKSIPSLATLLRKHKNGPFLAGRRKFAQEKGYWLPQVDYILRRMIGIDFETAKAKQAYFEDILGTMDAKDTRIERWKRLTRLKIIEEAKTQWTGGKYLTVDGPTVERLKDTCVPASELAKALFPPHALSEEARYLPRQSKAVYPRDPLATYNHAHQIPGPLFHGHGLEPLAASMVLELVRSRYQMTGLGNLMHEYHVKRLRASFGPQDVLKSHADLEQSGKGWLKRYQLGRILEKLFLVNNRLVHYDMLLSVRGKALAEEVLPKILERGCEICPQTKMLAPRGLEGNIDHVRKTHPRMFFDTDFDLLR